MDYLKALIFTIILLFTFNNAQSAAYVVPGVGGGLATVKPNNLNFWTNSILSTVGGDALVSKSFPVSAALNTANGTNIPLPANWSARVPRVSFAASAAKILVRATPVGLAGMALYEALSPLIGLQSNGSISAAGYSHTFLNYLMTVISRNLRMILANLTAFRFRVTVPANLAHFIALLTIGELKAFGVTLFICWIVRKPRVL